MYLCQVRKHVSSLGQEALQKRASAGRVNGKSIMDHNCFKDFQTQGVWRYNKHIVWWVMLFVPEGKMCLGDSTLDRSSIQTILDHGELHRRGACCPAFLRHRDGFSNIRYIYFQLVITLLIYTICLKFIKLSQYSAGLTLRVRDTFHLHPPLGYFGMLLTTQVWTWSATVMMLGFATTQRFFMRRPQETPLDLKIMRGRKTCNLYILLKKVKVSGASQPKLTTNRSGRNCPKCGPPM